MYLRVAVQTSTALRDVGSVPPAAGTAIWRGRRLNRRMRGGVAGVAKERRAGLQHAFSGSAMNVMADRAIFGDGLVVAHEGTTLFHVTGVAGFHNAVSLHQTWTRGAVGVMTVGAGHLAFDDRVM